MAVTRSPRSRSVPGSRAAISGTCRRGPAASRAIAPRPPLNPPPSASSRRGFKTRSRIARVAFRTASRSFPKIMPRGYMIFFSSLTDPKVAARGICRGCGQPLDRRGGSRRAEFGDASGATFGVLAPSMICRRGSRISTRRARICGHSA